MVVVVVLVGAGAGAGSLAAAGALGLDIGPCHMHPLIHLFYPPTRAHTRAGGLEWHVVQAERPGRLGHTRERERVECSDMTPCMTTQVAMRVST